MNKIELGFAIVLGITVGLSLAVEDTRATLVWTIMEPIIKFDMQACERYTENWIQMGQLSTCMQNVVDKHWWAVNIREDYLERHG